jgi:PBP1b-binding outer membrane lipoprotein LpoB
MKTRFTIIALALLLAGCSRFMELATGNDGHIPVTITRREPITVRDTTPEIPRGGLTTEGDSSQVPIR